MKRSVAGLLAGVLVAVIIALAAWQVRQRALYDPALAYLPDFPHAEWIRPDIPTSLRVQPLGELQTLFRTRFRVTDPPEAAPLTLHAMKQARVYLNHNLLTPESRPASLWKEPQSVELAPAIQLGPNELLIEVTNENGPRLVHAAAPALDLRTDDSWEWSADGESWAPVITANAIPPAKLAERFHTARAAFGKVFPWILGIFCLVGGLVLYWSGKLSLRASYFRWALITAWAVLAINNSLKIDFRVGFDIEGHINYIHFITEHGRLPYANEGWQTFQTPLYYLILLPFYAVFSNFWDLDLVIQALRFLTLACGIAQVELAYRAARIVFPDREDLQIAATFLGGLLPINLYLSQYIGNEPLAGLLSGITFVLGLRILCRPEIATTRAWLTIGVVLGLAILTKITAILLILPTLLLIAYVSIADTASPRPSRLAHVIRTLAIVAAPIAVITGWYFLRNCFELGRPVYGGWDPSREVVWWQDPGYRNAAQFTRFGEALLYPVTAGTQGMWDALYSTLWLDGLLSSIVEYEQRPPWNYPWMLAGAWLGLIPSFLMIAGAVRALFESNSALTRAVLYSAACLLLYWAAFAYLYFLLPAYSTGKATYTLGMLPAYAILAAAGLRAVAVRPALTAAAFGAVAAWATAAYAAYFVL